MTKPADNLLFATIDDLPLLNKEKLSREFLALEDNASFWDTYRNIGMIPLMTKRGSVIKDIKDKQTQFTDDLVWANYVPDEIVDWCEDYVFPFLGMRTRTMILITSSGDSNHEHIDCGPTELNTLQHKFRYVLQGTTDTLYWLTDKGKVYAPTVDKPFLMDGGWPHGMTNTSTDKKVTLAMGAPWNGNEGYDNITVLQDRNDFKMPDEIGHLWQKK